MLPPVIAQLLQSAETRLVVYQITLYQSCSRYELFKTGQILLWDLSFWLWAGQQISTTNPQVLLLRSLSNCRASVWQPGIQREVSVLNFLSETEKSAAASHRGETIEGGNFIPDISSLHLNSLELQSWHCVLLLEADMWNLCLSARSRGSLSHRACCSAVMSGLNDIWLYYMGCLI